ncbi:MAG TPA: ATP-dependent DNA ligase [Microbacteriaceae bacterium]|nr:ATP-dependent DNA ligase [Microbacteriaceae bacterium]
MGRLIYAGSPSDTYRIDDRVLAHLELAIGVKFRLGGSFAFTLDGDDVPSGTGYRVLWMHPSISLQFRYEGDRAALAVNPAWVGQLVASASTEGGLRIVPEPEGPNLPAPSSGPKPIYG